MTFDSTMLRVGTVEQLFLDNWLIERTDNLTRRWHKPQRLSEQPVLEADRPWEHFPYFTYSNYNVLKDPHDGKIKCWYEDLGPFEADQSHPWKARLLYAESTDGIHFEKPQMAHVEIEGHPTNVVAGYVEGAQPDASNYWAQLGVHSAAVVIDPDPASTDHRYRMLFSETQPDRTHAPVCAHSPDGIRWTRYPERPNFGASGDRLQDVSTITYDPRTKLFTSFTRHFHMLRAGVPASNPLGPHGPSTFPTFYPGREDLQNKRRVVRTVSADFINWTELMAMATPDEQIDNLDEGYYGIGQYRAGAFHMGTLGVFRFVDNEMEVRLLHSRDGLHWTAADKSNPFLAPRGGSHWDRHMVSIVSPPVRVGDQLFYYHGGCRNHHDWWMSGREKLEHEEASDPTSAVRFGLGIATLRHNGFASLEAHAPRTGQLVTRPIEPGGERLFMNARCHTNGTIRVAIADSDGKVLPRRSYDDFIPFTGDKVEMPLAWSDGMAFDPHWQPGSFYKLMFEVRDAEIYGFQFE